jgi:hypothetical protein
MRKLSQECCELLGRVHLLKQWTEFFVGIGPRFRDTRREAFWRYRLRFLLWSRCGPNRPSTCDFCGRGGRTDATLVLPCQQLTESNAGKTWNLRELVLGQLSTLARSVENPLHGFVLSVGYSSVPIGYQERFSESRQVRKEGITIQDLPQIGHS